MKPSFLLLSIFLIGCAAPDVGYRTIAGSRNCVENADGYRAAYRQKFDGWNKTLVIQRRGLPVAHAVAVFSHPDGVWVYDNETQRETWRLSSNPTERRPLILAKAWEFEKFATMPGIRAGTGAIVAVQNSPEVVSAYFQ